MLRLSSRRNNMRRLAAILILLLGASLALASPYNTVSPPALQSGSVFTVWSAETPTPGTGGASASQQVSLVPSPDGLTPFSIDGKFSGAPGAFEVDVQVASTDADGNYQTCSGCNVTAVDATNNTFHLDATLVHAVFVRLLMRTRTNSVSITAAVSR